jgi:hypothetical protein
MVSNARALMYLVQGHTVLNEKGNARVEIADITL